MAIAPIPPFPALSDRANGTYNGKAFDWASHMANTFVTEVNALVANLNSIAAGGAYAIPYVYTSDAVAGTDQKFKVSNHAAQGASTTLYINNVDARNANAIPALDSFAASSSAVKGTIRVYKQGDPSKWLRFNVTGIASFAKYRDVYVTPVDGSSTSPFAEGDAVLVDFQRTGDKGDKGDAGVVPVYPYAEFTEQHASGVSANGGATATNQYTRNLNTTVSNNIPGLSLSGGILTIQAGTYEFEAQACAVDNSSSQNRSLFHNITDNTHIVGMGAVLTGSTRNAFSTVGGRFTISSTKTFKLITDIGPVGTSPGQPLARGFVEIYAQLKLWKLA